MNVNRGIAAVGARMFAALLLGLLPLLAQSASRTEIDIEVDAALDRFTREVPGGAAFLKKARGVLVFGDVVKAGFGIGGEYGEGALRIGGKTVAYYSTAAASIGLQLGVQSKTVIIVFLEQKALDRFRASSGWEVGVDGSVALLDMGAAGSLDTVNVKDPIVAFVLTNKGLMYDLSIEGSKFTRLK